MASFTKRFAKMTIGDVTHDGKFDPSDLTALFQAGTFEDSVDANADWSTGDWNGDQDFDSSDLVFALRYGRYEVNSQQAVHAVPEPSTNTIAMILGTYVIGYMRRRHRHISEGPKA